MAIVKIIRLTSGWLIYDRARTHVVEVSNAAIPEQVWRAIGQGHQTYWNAAWVKDSGTFMNGVGWLDNGMWVLNHEQAPEQQW